VTQAHQSERPSASQRGTSHDLLPDVGTVLGQRPGLGKGDYDALRSPRLPLADPTAEADAWRLTRAVQEAFLAGYGPATAAAYAADLRDLNAYAAGIGTAPLLLRRTDLDRYLRMLLDERRLSAATVRRRASAVAGMFTWAVDEHLLIRNPAERLRRPRAFAAPPRVHLSRQDVTALLHAAERHSPRAAVLVHLLFAHGLRVSEAVGLDVEDVRPGTASSALIRGKGGALREVALSDRVAASVDVLSAGRAAGPLLRSRTGRRLHRTNAARLLKDVAAQALPLSTASRVHPHAGRRSFAVLCLDNGVGLRDLQQVLGHSSGLQSLRYADAARHHGRWVPDHLSALLRTDDVEVPQPVEDKPAPP
jgi:integrase/recombinase XerD